MDTICLLSQRIDHIAKRGQGLIDLLRLVKALTSSASHSDALASCQVDEVKLSDADRFCLIIFAISSLTIFFAVDLQGTHLLNDD